MNRFASGVLTGSIIAAAGIGWLMTNNKTRRRMVRGSRRAMRKTEDMINGVTEMF